MKLTVIILIVFVIACIYCNLHKDNFKPSHPSPIRNYNDHSTGNDAFDAGVLN